MPKRSKICQQLQAWLSTLSRGDRWCIVITADPDALGSAMALKRLMSRKVKDVTIASTNHITRPDNLAMLRYLRIPLVSWKPSMRDEFNCFAIVDSQPHHHAVFKDLPFSIIVDHHPMPESYCHYADFIDIRPKLGATCTIFCQYLRGLNVRPGKLLATAMLYGIRTDTATFERSGDEADFRAYQWLSKYSDTTLLRRILRSEYLQEWLPLFSLAFSSLRTCKRKALTYVGRVNSPDMLVAIADFFTRVHGLRWVAVSGIFEETLVVIFRGDGSTNLGSLAFEHFGQEGSAGGHRVMARAEIALDAIDSSVKVEDYVHEKIMKGMINCGK